MSSNMPQRRHHPFYLLSDLFGEESLIPKLNFSKEDGLTLSEDKQHVYVEAAMPGLKAEDIEVTVEQGMLWVRGERKEEEGDSNKKFYRRASTSFSYQCVLPGELDESHTPEASFKNGVMKVTFNKKMKEEPRRIQVKEQ